MNALIIDNGTTYLKDLTSLLKSTSVTFEIKKYSEIDESYNYFDFIVLSGGHDVFIVEENIPLLRREIDLILNSTKPILGICYGFELLCFTYGCKIHEKDKSKGVTNLKILINDPLLNNLNNIQVFENHKFYVNELSSELEGIAISEKGFEIIKHKNKKQYGFQFHPELLVNKLDGDELLINFIKLIK